MAPLLVDKAFTPAVVTCFFPTLRLLPRPQPSSQIEWVIPSDLARPCVWAAGCGRAGVGHTLFNRYSPTETTIDTAQIRYQLRQDHELQPMPFNDIQQPQERKALQMARLGLSWVSVFSSWLMGISSPGAMR
jgi:non-ribosomal peptide synthetase component F